MKFYFAILLLAIVAVAFADKPVDENTARDKRGLLYSAAYTSPLAYAAPVAYADSLPYVYSSYRAYPHYAPIYSGPYTIA